MANKRNNPNALEDNFFLTSETYNPAATRFLDPNFIAKFHDATNIANNLDNFRKSISKSDNALFADNG